MAVIMKRVALITTILSAAFFILNTVFEAEIWFSIAITCATTAYHFVMRLLVGFAFDRIMKNKADYTKKWFAVCHTEMRFYNSIKVKKWKKIMPTYDPDLFSPQKYTWDEIAQAMCQAELVHETIAVLSFIPIIMTACWGAFWVFLITSVCAAIVDVLFAIMQRYNRPRVVRLAEKNSNYC